MDALFQNQFRNEVIIIFSHPKLQAVVITQNCQVLGVYD